jgi:hypothetical protein
MFQRLYELSKCLPPRESWERLNEGMPENYDRGLAICFDDQGRWTGIESYRGNDHVVYRSGPPNGTDLTPCCKQASNTSKRLCDAVRKLNTHPDLPADKNPGLRLALPRLKPIGTPSGRQSRANFGVPAWMAGPIGAMSTGRVRCPSRYMRGRRPRRF